jgi:Contractile injection system spike tip protein
MSKQVLMTGDKVIFDTSFPPAQVIALPGTLIGSALSLKVNTMPVCVQGDEKKVVVPGCPYTAGSFSTPGVGILTIKQLAPDQLSKVTSDNNKKVLLKGSKFDATFLVVAPALMPAPPGPPVPDPLKMYNGKGSFLTLNTILTSE